MSAVSPASTPLRRHVLVRALVLFLLLAIPIAGAATAVLVSQMRAARTVAESNERNHVGLQAGVIAADFAAVFADLQYVTEGILRDSLKSPTNVRDQSQVAADLQRFLEERPQYLQVRYLDALGKEVVRVRTVGDRAELVPKALWRNHAGPQYLERGYALAPGQVFVSPFDLDLEGAADGGPTPTIRFCAPVIDSFGEKAGIVVLNYAGQALLQHFQQAASSSGGQTMLVNADGYWLFGGGKRDWAFMYPERSEESFATAYPEAWRTIYSGDAGQFVTERGMFTFRTVHPFQVDGTTVRLLGPHDLRTVPLRTGYAWKVLTFVPIDQLAGGRRQIWARLGPLYAALLPILAGLALVISRHRQDRERSAQALRENEQRFRQIAEGIEEVFWMVDLASGRLSYVSSAFARVWGGTSETAGTWPPRLHPEDEARVRAALQDIGAVGSVELEYRILRPDGQERWIRDRATAVFDAEGRPYRVAGLAEDVTEMREQQQRELQTQRLAAIGEAMTGLAHESRNALQRSQAGLEMLGRRVKDRPEIAPILAEIQESQRHLHRLYEEVRGYAAPIRPQRESCDIGKLIGEVWEQLAVAREGRDDQLIDHRNGEPLDCMVDRLSLGQVFRNVLENSLAATDPAIVNVEYHCVEQQGRPALRIEFRDNGPGLDPQQAARMFEPFFTTKSRGTGLGMAISKRIVEAHGGQIDVRNHPVGGAAVSILLPRGGE